MKIKTNLNLQQRYQDLLNLVFINNRGFIIRTHTNLYPEDINEKLLQQLWVGRLFLHNPLKTLSNKALEIINPGRWNKEAGPDFINAQLKIGDKIIKGDVEIHILSSDWKNHKHYENPQYQNVVLHIIYKNDLNSPIVKGFMDSSIEQLELSDIVNQNRELLPELLSMDEYTFKIKYAPGLCSQNILSHSENEINELLEVSGLVRIENKISRFHKQLEGENFDQVLYQSLMTAMGYKSSKHLFFLLSKRAPYKEIKEIIKFKDENEAVLFIQALLMNVANLIRFERIKPSLDEETQIYLNKLNSIWSGIASIYSDRIIPSSKGWYVNVRPPNFPLRRIAGISYILTRTRDKGLFLSFFDIVKETLSAFSIKEINKIEEALIDIFTMKLDEYWSHRFSLNGKKTQNPVSLIGIDRSYSIILNCLFPLIIIYARNNNLRNIETKILDLYKYLHFEQENVITRFMKQRLFGQDKQKRKLVDTFIKQMGLFQIFFDCCNSEETTCDRCAFGLSYQ